MDVRLLIFGGAVPKRLARSTSAAMDADEGTPRKSRVAPLPLPNNSSSLRIGGPSTPICGLVALRFYSALRRERRRRSTPSSPRRATTWTAGSLRTRADAAGTVTAPLSALRSLNRATPKGRSRLLAEDPRKRRRLGRCEGRGLEAPGGIVEISQIWSPRRRARRCALHSSDRRRYALQALGLIVEEDGGVRVAEGPPVQFRELAMLREGCYP